MRNKLLAICAAALIPLLLLRAHLPRPLAPVSRKICDLKDTRIDESSGLAASRRYAKEQLLWTHNDSGGEPTLYCINMAGETVADANLQGAQNIDWEDIGISGQWIYVADCGDNRERRPNITIYRLHEPELNPKNLGAKLTSSFETMTLKYPDGSHNCETILPFHDGTLLFVSKKGGISRIYKTPLPFKDGASQTLEDVGEFAFSDGGEKPNPYSMLTTGGSVANDEKHLVIRTYTRAYEWTIPAHNDWKTMWTKKPRVWDLPSSKQGESICYSADGSKYYATSEQLPTPLFEIEK
jgi:hypothetical protein